MNPWLVSPGLRRDGEAVEFTVLSRHAEQVHVCLLDGNDQAGWHESSRVAMTRCPDGRWYHRQRDCRAGQRYGYRAEGPWNPRDRHCFNVNRFLLDPCAQMLAGELRHGDAVCNVPPTHPAFGIDSLPFMPHAVVPGILPPVHDSRPCVPWEDTVIYEAHVRGLTMQHPDVDVLLRGRYGGLCAPAVIQHLKRLGVTTLQLMPVQSFVDERFLVQSGRTNYWGYNPLAWWVPTSRYAATDPIAELRDTVSCLHGHGIEVILDVVFNHTAESGMDGMTLSLRGLDNALYYQADPEDAARLSNVTGCGNAVSLDDPSVLALVADCLRYWAVSFGVDGFRFDLASTLCRRSGAYDEQHPLWWVIRQDPLLGKLKWIVEPWDAGPGGYQLGRYPGWIMQLNDQFRDQVRRVIRGDHGQCAGLAKRLAGSWDIFTGRGQHLLSGVNPVATHDGFTLLDIVSYSHKHNMSNGEGNQDGHDENYSHNAGVEGVTGDAGVQATRLRRRCNAILLLAFAQGIPMLSHGDEVGYTRGGNNNGWCMDGPQAWVDWQQGDDVFLRFMASAMQLRHELGVGRLGSLAREGWRTVNECLTFWKPDGLPMEDADWSEWYPRGLTMEAGSGAWWLLCNFSGTGQRFTLPRGRQGRVCLSSVPVEPDAATVHDAVTGNLHVGADSVALAIAPGSPTGNRIWSVTGSR